MTRDGVYPANGGWRTAVPVNEEAALESADELLLYQAKQNVNDKRNLIRHVAVFIISLPVLLFFYAGVFQQVQHPRWNNLQAAFLTLDRAWEYLPEEYTWAIARVNNLQWYFRHGYTPAIWYVIVGAMLAWGMWIAFRIAKRVVGLLKRKVKADPVVLEYNRLKRMAHEEAM